MSEPKLGQVYTRDKIHEMCGGNKQTYLPTVKKVVVCACLDRRKNAEAPDVIYCGVRPRVRENAEILASQTEAIPVFVKQKVGQWKYVGEYLVAGSKSGKSDLAKYIARANRPLSRVVFMKRDS